MLPPPHDMELETSDDQIQVGLRPCETECTNHTMAQINAIHQNHALTLSVGITSCYIRALSQGS